MIRVAIVEDHPAIADGLAELMRGSSDVSVVGTARDVSSASALIERESPDVVLCDIRLTDAGDGLDLLGRHRPGPAFIILSAYWYPSYHIRAVELGARGYLSKMATIEQIIAAVKTVAAGGTAFPAAARQAASDALRVPTPRELEILALVAEGLSNEDIATRLFVSPATAKTHVSRAMIKLGARDRAQLVVFAYQSGLSQA